MGQEQQSVELPFQHIPSFLCCSSSYGFLRAQCAGLQRKCQNLK